MRAFSMNVCPKMTWRDAGACRGREAGWPESLTVSTANSVDGFASDGW